MTQHESDPDLDRLGEALRASTAVHLAGEGQTARASTTPSRAGLLRRRPALAGGTLGLASIGVALVLILGAGGASAPPAFAVTPHHNGTVSVQIYRRSGIVGANRRLASLGIHERLRAVTVGASGQTVTRTVTRTVHGNTVISTVYGNAAIGAVAGNAVVRTVFEGTKGTQKCLKDQTTGGVVDVIFSSPAAEQKQIVNGTYVPPANAGNTGGTPNNGPWHVVICPATPAGVPVGPASVPVGPASVPVGPASVPANPATSPAGSGDTGNTGGN